MKKISIYLLCLLFTLSACDNSSSSTLPDSTGRVDEIIVVMDNEKWEGESGKALRRILNDAFLGLPQPEPRFDLRRVSPTGMEKLLRRSSSILYVGTEKGAGETDRAIQDKISQLPEDKKARYMFSVRDVWAAPQQVTYLFGKDTKDLINVIDKRKKQITERLYAVEDIKAGKNAYASQVNKGFSAHVKKTLGFEFDVPQSFKEVIFEDTLLWFRQDLTLLKKGTEVSNLLLHVKPYEDESVFTNEYAVNMRNELGKKIQSDKPNAMMTTEMRSKPVYKKYTTEDGFDIIESRGLWRMTEGFKGGPFLNYLVKDKKNKRIIMFDGFVYSPESKKRQAIRKLESMFKTLKAN